MQMADRSPQRALLDFCCTLLSLAHLVFKFNHDLTNEVELNPLTFCPVNYYFFKDLFIYLFI